MVIGMSETEIESLQALNLTDDREGKLPAWARQLLATMRRRVAEAEALAAAAQLATAPDESDALLDRYGRTVGLGHNPQVDFRVTFPGHGRENGWISIRQLGDRPGLYVHGSDEIVTRNRSINAIEVVPWPKLKP
jgi:hypothetical protein